MSVSTNLQDLIDALMRSDANVAAICGDRIYDKVPEGAAYPYISMGPSDYHPDDSECIAGRVETIQIDCWSRDQGYLTEVKGVVDAVKKALHGQSGDLGVNALVLMRVTLARAFLDSDGITAHGVVQVEANIEEG